MFSSIHPTKLSQERQFDLPGILRPTRSLKRWRSQPKRRLPCAKDDLPKSSWSRVSGRRTRAPRRTWPSGTGSVTRRSTAGESSTVTWSRRTSNGTVKLTSRGRHDPLMTRFSSSLSGALVHESKLTRGRPCREATHRPILYDTGRQRSVICPAVPKSPKSDARSERFSGQA